MRTSMPSIARSVPMSAFALGVGLFGWLAVGGGPAVTADERPPNILLVIADDLGVDASPCYDTGTDKPNMPTLSRLCRQGLVFDRFWAAPECSPTRASILTGRYGFRTGIGTAVQRDDAGLSTDELSLQTFIAQSGIAMASAVIGKWHLASNANGWEQHPSRMGVSHYVGLLSGAAPSYSRWSRTENGQTATSTAYITTELTDQAIAWTAKQQTPWFLWLAYTAPHEPLHLPPAHLHSQTDLSGSAEDIRARPQSYFFALAESMDRELGRLLDSFAEDTRARTVVLFIGDNGTNGNVIQPASDRARAKSTLYEGGVHTPLVVSGANVLRAGERESALVNSVDLFATISQLAGSTVTAYQDSVSFAGRLSTPGASPRPEGYMEYFGSDRADRHGWALRDERFKLIVFDSGERRLFDLERDPTERTDLFAATDADAQRARARLLARGEELRAAR